MTRPGPLAGLRIIELSAYVATPLAGMSLAQLGADVIRIEPLGGQSDRTRMPVSREGTSMYWCGLNQGKRAVEVNLRSSEGRALVADLIEASGEEGGIVVTNTTTLAGLGAADLRVRRPDLIHVLLTGHRDGRTGVDYTVQAAVGLHALTGPRDVGGPVNNVFPFWDLACGLHLATGLLAAERRRRLTGEGAEVRVALQDVAMSAVSQLGWLTDAQVGTEPRGRAGNDVYGMFGRDFVTGDGQRLMLVLVSTRHWRQLLEVTGLTEAMAALERALGIDFSRENERFRHRQVVGGLLEPWFAARTLAEIEAALAGTSLLTQRFQTFADLVADDAAALAADPLFRRVDQPGIGPYWLAGSPIEIDGVSGVARTAPAVGADSADVLGELLGWDSARVGEARERSVVGR